MLPEYYSPFDLSEGLDILVILSMTTQADLLSGEWLSGPENDFVLDYLNGFGDRASWAVTALFAEPRQKPSAKEVKEAAPALIDRVAALRPKVIVTLGNEALRAMWPSEYGPLQSITKAKAMDLDWAGVPLIASVNPSSHRWFLETSGRVGSDLTQEYLRAFTKVGAILEGTYAPRTFTYTCIDTVQDALWLLQRKQALGINVLDFDTEDTTWWPKPGEKLTPHRWPDHLPEKLTLWHQDTQLDFCSVTWQTPEGKYETYSLHPRVMTYEFVYSLFTNCTVRAWNILYEIASMWRFCGFDLTAPQHNITLYDGMIRYCVRDQSVTAIGLKGVCEQAIGAPPWDLKLQAELASARARRLEECGVSVAAIDDCDVNVRREYNAADTYYMAVLIDEYLEAEKDGGLHPDCRAYEELIAALPFFALMERTGDHIDLEYLYDMIDEKEALVKEYEEKIRNHWAVEMATYVAQKERFNSRSPICFMALVAVTYGTVHPQRELTDHERTLKSDVRKKIQQDIIKESLEVPDWCPLTKKKTQLSSGTSAMELYAMGGKDPLPTTFEGLSDLEDCKEIWRLLKEHREHEDDLLKYYTILNYTSSVDSRIHASYRIVRSANEGDDNATGAKSGRTSTTPNAQNRKPELKPCSKAPPGRTKVMIDLKGAEMRVVGVTTGDETFLSWARQGRDSHLEKGAILWGYATGRDPEEFFQYRSREECAALDEPHELQKPWRRLGKTLNFAALYMQEPRTFAKLIGISEEEAVASAMRDRQMAPGVYAAQCALYDKLQKGLPAVTYIFGRVRYAHGWVPSDQTAHEFLSLDPDARKDHNNMKIFRSIWNTWAAQADANDIGIVKGRIITRMLQTGVLDPHVCHLTTFIHDALVFDILDEYVDTYVPILAQIIEDVTNLPVPFPVPLNVSVEKGPDMGNLSPIDWRKAAKWPVKEAQRENYYRKTSLKRWTF